MIPGSSGYRLALLQKEKSFIIEFCSRNTHHIKFQAKALPGRRRVVSKHFMPTMRVPKIIALALSLWSICVLAITVNAATSMEQKQASSSSPNVIRDDVVDVLFHAVIGETSEGDPAGNVLLFVAEKKYEQLNAFVQDLDARQQHELFKSVLAMFGDFKSCEFDSIHEFFLDTFKFDEGVINDNVKQRVISFMNVEAKSGGDHADFCRQLRRETFERLYAIEDLFPQSVGHQHRQLLIEQLQSSADKFCTEFQSYHKSNFRQQIEDDELDSRSSQQRHFEDIQKEIAAMSHGDVLSVLVPIPEHSVTSKLYDYLVFQHEPRVKSLLKDLIARMLTIIENLKHELVVPDPAEFVQTLIDKVSGKVSKVMKVAIRDSLTEHIHNFVNGRDGVPVRVSERDDVLASFMQSVSTSAVDDVAKMLEMEVINLWQHNRPKVAFVPSRAFVKSCHEPLKLAMKENAPLIFDQLKSWIHELIDASLPSLASPEVVAQPIAKQIEAEAEKNLRQILEATIYREFGLRKGSKKRIRAFALYEGKLKLETVLREVIEDDEKMISFYNLPDADFGSDFLDDMKYSFSWDDDAFDQDVSTLGNAIFSEVSDLLGDRARTHLPDVIWSLYRDVMSKVFAVNAPEFYESRLLRAKQYRRLTIEVFMNRIDDENSEDEAEDDKALQYLRDIIGQLKQGESIQMPVNLSSSTQKIEWLELFKGVRKGLLLMASDIVDQVHDDDEVAELGALLLDQDFAEFVKTHDNLLDAGDEEEESVDSYE